MTLYDRLIAEGEAKGIAQGIAAGRRASGGDGRAQPADAHTFGPVPPELSARVRAASGDELAAMADRMMSATSAAEVVG